MTRNLAILLFDDVEVLDFCGPFEVFSVANNLRNNSEFVVYTVAEKTSILANNGLSVNADYTFDNGPKPDILLVPGGIGTRKEMNNERLLKWIKQVATEAELVLSVCTGALILGKIGLLDGLEATTHHSAFDLLREIVSTGVIHEDRRFVDNGSVITSAGVAAGIDMSLHVVERLLGNAVSEATSSRMEYPWESVITKPSTNAEVSEGPQPLSDSFIVVESLSEEYEQQLHQLIQQQWWGSQRSLDDVRVMVENSSLMIGIIDRPSNRLVGYCRVLTDFVFRATIYDVMVDRDWQGQGFGKHLLHMLSSHPKLQQVSLIYLACEPALFSFYEKWGFQEYESRAHWMIKVQREE